MAQDKDAASAGTISSRTEAEAAGDFEKIEGLLPEDEDGAVVEGADDEDPDGLYDEEAEEDGDGEEDEDADADEDADEDDDSDSGAEPTITIEEDGKKVKLTAKEVRESRLRHADYTKKTMALADQRKETEAKAAKADEHVKVYGGLVTEYRKHLDTILRNEPDWDKLRADDPQQYLLVKEEWRSAQAERDAAKSEEDRLAGEEREKQGKALAAFLDAETVKLLEALPAWKKDKAVAQREALAIRNFLRRRGLNDQEMTTVLSDHRSVLIVRDAALFDQAQRKGKTKIRPAKPVRKVLRPGSTNTPAVATSGRTGSRAAQARLRETGHVRDAADVFSRMPGLFDGKK